MLLVQILCLKPGLFCRVCVFVCVGSRAARNGFILWSADTVVNICVQAPPITSRFTKVSKHIWGEYLDSFNLYEEGKPSLAGDMDTEGWQRGRWGSGALLTLFWEFYISRYSTFSPPTMATSQIYTHTQSQQGHTRYRGGYYSEYLVPDTSDHHLSMKATSFEKQRSHSVLDWTRVRV